MRSTGRLRRALVGTVLFVWCGLTAIAPAADAASEQGTARSHVEQLGGSANCFPAHDASICQLCRLLTLGSEKAPPQTVDTTADASQTLATADVTSLPGRRVEASAQPRAPPIS